MTDTRRFKERYPKSGGFYTITFGDKLPSRAIEDFGAPYVFRKLDEGDTFKLESGFSTVRERLDACLTSQTELDAMSVELGLSVVASKVIPCRLPTGELSPFIGYSPNRDLIHARLTDDRGTLVLAPITLVMDGFESSFVDSSHPPHRHTTGQESYLDTVDITHFGENLSGAWARLSRPLVPTFVQLPNDDGDSTRTV